MIHLYFIVWQMKRGKRERFFSEAQVVNLGGYRGLKTFESIESFGKNIDNLAISQIIDLKN